MSSVKKALITDQTMNRRSTSPATVDADSGKRGNCCWNGWFMSGRPHGTGLRAFPPLQEHDQEPEAQHGRDRGEAQDVHGHGAVFAVHRIVMEAIEEDLVGQVADPAVRRFD